MTDACSYLVQARALYSRARVYPRSSIITPKVFLAPGHCRHSPLYDYGSAPGCWAPVNKSHPL
jgi:hypothetical protein